MKKKILRGLALGVLLAAVAVSSHIWTICNLCIETDGNGDSAILEVAGHYWFYGINGHEPDGEFYAEYDGTGFGGAWCE